MGLKLISVGCFFKLDQEDTNWYVRLVYCYRILGCGSLRLWAGAAAFNVGVVLDASAGIITAVRLGYKQALKGLV